MAEDSVPCPSVSSRIANTDVPVIVQSRRAMSLRPGTLSLAQGIVHWQPPASAIEHAAKLVAQKSSPQQMQQQQQLFSSTTSGDDTTALSSYGPDEGLPVLREALRQKLKTRNKLDGYDVMVTSGANQAFTNVTLTLLDPTDKAVLFLPYYFNHHMALQMALQPGNILYGKCDPATLKPSPQWLQHNLQGVKMVVVTNPCNPSGVLLDKGELEELSGVCARVGAWLVVDNTYEDFVFDGAAHHCPGGPHVLHIFSFSKASGMMGWRVGYVAYPAAGEAGEQLLKAQDTIAICAPQISQHLAHHCVVHGGDYIHGHISALEENRKRVGDALSVLKSPDGVGVVGGQAIYFWAQLPEGCQDDFAVVEWMVRQHGVCVVPGSSCGVPGCVRVAFANLKGEAFVEAADRLKRAMQELVAGGRDVLEEGMMGVTQSG